MFGSTAVSPDTTPERMRTQEPSCRLAGVALLSLTLIAACVDATEPRAEAKAGAIRVTSATTGPDLDSDGYVVTVDSAATAAGRLAPNESITLAGLREGPHAIWLRDLAETCAVAGPNPQTVAVSSRETATIAFPVTCAGRSTVRIITETRRMGQ
jgi:hypothetical protein